MSQNELWGFNQKNDPKKKKKKTDYKLLTPVSLAYSSPWYRGRRPQCLTEAVSVPAPVHAVVQWYDPSHSADTGCLRTVHHCAPSSEINKTNMTEMAYITTYHHVK